MNPTIHAQSWATYQSKLSFLTHILDHATLTSQQTDFLSDTLNNTQSYIDQLETYIFDNYPESYYYNMRNQANTLTVTLSPEFTDTIESQLVNLDMSDSDYQIHEAVEQYNQSYYSCSITLNEYGHISYHGCSATDNNSTTVLFTKGGGNHTITISDVHNKLNQLQHA